MPDPDFENLERLHGELRARILEGLATAQARVLRGNDPAAAIASREQRLNLLKADLARAIERKGEAERRLEDDIRARRESIARVEEELRVARGATGPLFDQPAPPTQPPRSGDIR
jgi:hypothetical protein